MGSTVPVHAGGKDIFGWVERVLVGESRLEMQAKLYTGADTSSIHATKIRRYRGAGGRTWVEFRLTDEGQGRRVRFKKRLVRFAYIKEHEGPSQRRPVERLEICLGDHEQQIEVSLVDRSSFDYPVLLGRNALEKVAVIDPELRLTTKPSCAREEKH